MNKLARPSRHLVWPACRFYWALLDASVLPKRPMRRHPDSRALSYLFESQLPVSIDRVHAVYLPAEGSRYLACGLEEERLSENADLSDALTLRPDAIPVEIAPECAVDAVSINLLTGSHEPAPVRRERRRLLIELAAAILLNLLAVVLGAERRIDALDQSAAKLAASRQAVFDELYPARSTAPSSQPESLRLLAELRQLESTRGGVAPATDLEESPSGRTLAALLTRWPAGQPMMTESISVTPEAVTIVGVLPTASAAQDFVAAFELPSEWEARQSQISAIAGGVRLTWRLARRSPVREFAERSHP